MAANTTIEWASKSWNPVRGCSRVSAGCDECYAMKFAHRFSGPGKPYEGLTTIRRGKVDWTGVARLVPKELDAPLRWRKPERIFVNSMSDLFHPSLSDADIMRVWLVMARAPQHQFLILTKRPERMADWLTRWSDVEPASAEPVMARGPEAVRASHTSGRALMFAQLLDGMGEPPPGCAFPTYDWMEGPRWLPTVLPQVWLGTSVEDQQLADERIPHLLRCPAAVRFLSYEPALGPLRLPDDAAGLIHWGIVGSESGPGARPMDLAWVRAFVGDCHKIGASPFVKQIANERDKKGGDPKFWPAGNWPREWPEVRP